MLKGSDEDGVVCVGGVISVVNGVWGITVGVGCLRRGERSFRDGDMLFCIGVAAVLLGLRYSFSGCPGSGPMPSLRMT